MAASTDQHRRYEAEHDVVDVVEDPEALVEHLQPNDEHEPTMPREVEVAGGTVRHHEGRYAWIVEADKLRELEEEQRLAQGSTAVEDHEGVDDARASGVADEAVAEEDEHEIDPSRRQEDHHVSEGLVGVQLGVEVGGHLEHTVMQTGGIVFAELCKGRVQ